MTTPDAPPVPPPRSWLQFSLRGLLLLTALVALFFGWREWRCWPAREQAAAIAAIREAGGRIEVQSRVDPFVFLPVPIERTLSWEEAWLGTPQPQTIQSVTVPRLPSDTIEEIVRLDPPDLTILGNDITPTSLAGLARLTRLESLTLFHCRLAPLALDELQSVPTLRRLGIASPSQELIAESLRRLRHLPALEGLELAVDRLEDEAVAEISGCRHLKKLRLDQCARLTPRCLDRLTDLPSLEELDFPYPFHLDGGSLSCLARFPSLVIAMGNLRPVAEDACDFEYTPFRRMLTLSHGRLQAADVRLIAACPIEALRIQDAGIAEECWPELARLQGLRELEISAAVECRDDQLLHLAELPALQTLRLLRSRARDQRVLWQVGVTPEGFADFASRCPQLEPWPDDTHLALRGRYMKQVPRRGGFTASQ